ncbi:DoxX family protein [Amycolatopsis suaedae]|uniref:DoxX family protein n=1 Tax=Amycolatopsis suaedae TaxID=2510978 RepID=A0A4Q7J6C5_9PSEU|nr:DoxX family protein [Amycolatopsis suaedae]RZQ62438.1 DoxX family protein [Amycolatopsis suaedae]
MEIVTTVVIVVTAVACVFSAVVDWTLPERVFANAGQVRVPRSWLPALGALKAAGAAGLVAGLAGVPFIGVAAAAGLVLFFVGAVGAHVRARVFHNIGYAVSYLVLSIASFVLIVLG